MVESKGNEVTLPEPLDCIQFSSDLKNMQLINSEKLLFADMVKKTNMFDWTQKRILVITSESIYNVHQKKVKRMIRIKDLDGISKTTNSRAKNEFTVHVPLQYDYRFETDKRE